MRLGRGLVTDVNVIYLLEAGLEDPQLTFQMLPAETIAWAVKSRTDIENNLCFPEVDDVRVDLGHAAVSLIPT